MLKKTVTTEITLTKEDLVQIIRTALNLEDKTIVRFECTMKHDDYGQGYDTPVLTKAVATFAQDISL